MARWQLLILVCCLSLSFPFVMRTAVPQFPNDIVIFCDDMGDQPVEELA